MKQHSTKAYQTTDYILEGWFFGYIWFECVQCLYFIFKGTYDIYICFFYHDYFLIFLFFRFLQLLPIFLISKCWVTFMWLRMRKTLHRLCVMLQDMEEHIDLRYVVVLLLLLFYWLMICFFHFFLLFSKDVYEFIQRRSDWKKIEKIVDKTMYSLSFKEDCIISWEFIVAEMQLAFPENIDWVLNCSPHCATKRGSMNMEIIVILLFYTTRWGTTIYWEVPSFEITWDNEKWPINANAHSFWAVVTTWHNNYKCWLRHHTSVLRNKKAF